MFALSSNSDPSGALALGTVGGVWMFFKGFRVFREYKVIEDTPRINIRSVAMGLVHIRGKAKLEPPILSPVSKTPCCFYKVEIEQWKSEGKSHAWKHIRTDVDGSKFLLADGTGEVPVDAHSAEIDVPMTTERIVDSERPGSVASGASDAEVLQYVTYSGVHKMATVVEHFLEKRGELADPKREEARQTLLSLMQAVPNAAHGGGVPIEFVEKMAARFPVQDPAQELKRQEVLAHFREMAQGGMVQLPIHSSEGASGRYRLKEYVIVPGQEYTITATCAENPRATSGDRNLICKGQHESTFLISSKTDSGAEKSLRNRALGMVLGGAALSLVCLALLLVHLKLF
ncbi:MAG TPA: hypothetical protein VMT53_27345 [Terriglobales bacterium]|nr:hypothetical protein [Terriglobales bacterium]